MICIHLVFSTEGRQAGWPTEAHRLDTARAIVRVAGDALVAWCVVDDHVHVVLFCTPDEAGRLRRALLLALRARTATRLSPAHVTVAERRRHQLWLVDYLLTQPRKHQLDVHPALWSGSCLPNLVGARYLGPPSFARSRLLPRWRPEQALEAVGLGTAPLARPDRDAVRRVGLTGIARAATAAAGVSSFHDSKRGAANEARRVVATWGRSLGTPTAEIAAVLGTSERTARRLARQPAPAPLVDATLLRLALEARVDEVLRTAGLTAR